MRPKKVILLVCSDIISLSVLKTVLTVNGFRVLDCETAVEAVAIYTTSPYVDLVIADSAEPVRLLKNLASHVPMIILGDREKLATVHTGADALLDKRTTSPLELLERAKIMSARKRGPRKKLPQPETQPAEIAAIA